MVKEITIEKEVFDAIIVQAFFQIDHCMRGLYDCSKCEFANETENNKYICKRLLSIDALENINKIRINLI